MMAELHLMRPLWLIAFIPLVLLVWLMWHYQQSGTHWRAACDSHLLPHLLMARTGRERRWPLLAVGLAGALAILALAGPAWKKLPQPVYRQQSALVIALDLSRSMNAQDLRPSRLTRAKLKVRDILERRREGQTGLIVFASQAFVLSPLTQDAATIAAQVPVLESALMPAQGSRADLALRKAGELLDQSAIRGGQILLITDGTDLEVTRPVVKALQQQGRRLSVLAVGTTEGAPIPLMEGGFLKDAAGSIVVPKLDETKLRTLAQEGDGHYSRLSADDTDLNRLRVVNAPDNLSRQTEATDLTSDRWREEGPWLLLPLIPLAALAFRRGYWLVLVTLSLTLPDQARAWDWEALWLNADQRGQRALQREAPDDAAALFNNPEWKAAAHYRAGQYEQALSALQGAESADALYNRANALARLGRVDEAIQAYDKALEQAPDHEDAAYNRELLKRQQQQRRQAGQQNQTQQRQQQGQQSGQDSPAEQNPAEKNKSQQDREIQNGQHPNDSNQTDDPQASRSQSTAESEHSGDNRDDTQGDTGSEDQPAGDSVAQNGSQEQADGGEPLEAQPEEASVEPSEHAASELQGDSRQPPGVPDQNDQQTNPPPQAQAQDDETGETDRPTSPNEHWLRRIPDDPGGLLRRKFRYQYQTKNHAELNEEQPW